jgi:hypothetical protein
MNVERLYTVAQELQQDLNQTGVLNIIGQISGSLQNITNQQNNGSHLQQLTNQLNQLKQKCSESALNEFPPLWEQVITELGFSPFGNELYEKINDSIQRNQLTVPEAKKEIDQINSKFTARKKALDQMLSSFSTLELGSEELEPGECEVGVLVPRKFVKNDLNSLSDEFGNLNNIFGVFDEIATGSRSGFEVNSISSSDFGLYIAAAAPVVLIISQSIDKLMNAYKNYWEVKKIKQELEEKNVPSSNLGGLNDHIETIVKNSIDELVEDLIKKAHPNLDKGRKNELKLELRISLNKLANRLDRGFNIEVRMAPPEIEEGDLDESEEESSAASYQTQELYEQIKAYSNNFTLIENDHDPIVFLTENIEDLKKGPTRKKATKKTTKKKT